MKDKIILHIDINYFFAQVEEIKNPSLKNKPVAVASNVYKGVISSANYIARKKGVYASQKTYDALKVCEDLIIVKSNMYNYKLFSKRFFNCLEKNFTNEIEYYSIDECYIDATNLIKKYHDNIFILVNKIYKTIINETGLKTSIGVGNNKFLAKSANDISDKSTFYNTLFKNEIEQKLYNQKISNIFFVGKKTNEIFNSLQIKTVSDFINYKNKEHLIEKLKTKYFVLISFFSGNSSDKLDKNDEDNKSISLAETFLFTTAEVDFIKNKIIELSNELFKKMMLQNLIGKTYILSLRNEFKKTITRSYTIDKKIDNSKEFSNMFIKIFNKNWDSEMINQISVGISNLEKYKKNYIKKQLCLFDND